VREGKAMAKQRPVTARNEANERRRTAYHEAGHAVMAFELGLSIREVTIVPDDAGNFLGRVTGTPLGPDVMARFAEYDPDRHLVEQLIMFPLAGGIAEQELTGQVENLGDEDDLTNSFDLALRVCGSDEEANLFVEGLWERTRAQIQSPPTWAAVEAVAAALLGQQRLSGRKARAIYRSAQNR
jgi:hypothetical protein